MKAGDLVRVSDKFPQELLRLGVGIVQKKEELLGAPEIDAYSILWSNGEIICFYINHLTIISSLEKSA